MRSSKMTESFAEKAKYSLSVSVGLDAEGSVIPG